MKMNVSQGNGFFLTDVSVADDFLSRFKGLMLKKGLGEKQGLLLTKTSRIHTHFMRFTIDVIYLDNDYRVLDKETVKPWKIGKCVKGAVQVLEVSEAMASAVSVGEVLSVQHN